MGAAETMRPIRLGDEVELELPRGAVHRGEIVCYRQIDDRYEATIRTAEGAYVRGVVIRRGERLEMDDADAIARAVIAGRDLRLPVQRLLQVLATAVLARRGAA